MPHFVSSVFQVQCQTWHSLKGLELQMQKKKKKSFQTLSTGTKKNSCNPGGKLAGHLQNVILQFVTMLLFLIFLLQLFYVCEGKTCPFFFHSPVAVFFFLLLRTRRLQSFNSISQ